MARAPAAKPAAASEASAGGSVGRDDVGFLLAKATQRWNELLASRFAAAGYADLRPSYGRSSCRLTRTTGCGSASSPVARG